MEYPIIFEEILRTNFEYQQPGILAFAPAFDNVSQKIKSINEYANQEATKFIAGARNLNEFDQFISEMKTKGSDDVVIAYNEWYANK